MFIREWLDSAITRLPPYHVRMLSLGYNPNLIPNNPKLDLVQHTLLHPNANHFASQEVYFERYFRQHPLPPKHSVLLTQPYALPFKLNSFDLALVNLEDTFTHPLYRTLSQVQQVCTDTALLVTCFYDKSKLYPTLKTLKQLGYHSTVYGNNQPVHQRILQIYYLQSVMLDLTLFAIGKTPPTPWFNALDKENSLMLIESKLLRPSLKPLTSTNPKKTYQY